MLVPDIEVGRLSLSTIGITQRRSKFSRSYPILPYVTLETDLTLELQDHQLDPCGQGISMDVQGEVHICHQKHVPKYLYMVKPAHETSPPPDDHYAICNQILQCINSHAHTSRASINAHL